MTAVPHNEGLADCGSASNSNYINRLCRCDACKAAHAKAESDRNRRRLYGTDLFVDAAPVRERLERLYAQGYSQRELARLGVPKSDQNAIMNGHQRTGRPVTRCTRALAQKVMAVRRRDPSDRQRVPADQAAAIVRLWVISGLSVLEIERVTGVNKQTLYDLNNGRRETIEYRNLRALLDHRDELDLARPIVSRQERHLLVVATDKYGDDLGPMMAEDLARKIAADVRMVLVAARSEKTVRGWRVRRAELIPSPATNPRPGCYYVCYKADVPVATARTKRELAEMLGVGITTIESWASPSYRAKAAKGRNRTIVERVSV